MDRGEIKACDACRAAKRKCTKQLPACERCAYKGLSCTYPPRLSFFVYGSGFDSSSISSTGIDHLVPTPGLEALEPPPTYQQNEHSSALSQRAHISPTITDLQTAWFLTEDSWTVAPLNHDLLTPVCCLVLKRYITKVQGWLRDWVTNGSNTFIHPQLYKFRIPRCIQDAFTALSTYTTRTPATEPMIFHIVEDKATELVKSHEEKQQHTQLDAFEHLARVHALVVYLMIRLFDGDIRQRHFAEQHLSTLHDWTSQMLAAAAGHACDGTLLLSNAIDAPALTPPPSAAPALHETLLWHAWILSESIRRTWMLSEVIRTIYINMQRGEAECPGDLMLTSRKGVWEARSALAWTRTCAERSVGFMHRHDTVNFLEQGKPEELDTFSMALMELDYGIEKMERWGVEVEVGC